MGKPVLYIKQGKTKTHIFAEAGEWWTAICSSRIIEKNVRVGRIKEVDCGRCRTIYNPGIHLHN